MRTLNRHLLCGFASCILIIAAREAHGSAALVTGGGRPAETVAYSLRQIERTLEDKSRATVARRQANLLALRGREEEVSIPILSRLARDEAEPVGNRELAISIMIVSRAESTPGELIHCLKSRDSRIRVAAVQGLRYLSNIKVLPESQKAPTVDPTTLYTLWERWWRANAETYSPPSRLELLRRMAKVLCRMDNLPRQVAEEPLPNPKHDLSPGEIQKLAAQAAQIRDHLRDKSPAMTRKRGAAISALRRLHHESAIPPLLAVARDEQEAIQNRKRATMAIALSGGQAAVTALVGLINSDAPSVRSLSLQGLRGMTGHRVLANVPTPGMWDAVKKLNGDDLAALQKQWQQWWEENQATCVLRRRFVIGLIF